MSPEEMRERVRCCACGGMLRRGSINMVQTGKAATWQYPTVGNVISGASGEAIAIVCDGCIKREKDATRAVEFRAVGDRTEVHYYRLDSLLAAAPPPKTVEKN